MTQLVNQVRAMAEADLLVFIKLVAPHRHLGSIHEEVISWLTRQNHGTHQLILLPRDHMKSAIVAYLCAWEITKNPAIRILYISSTSKLAIKQLRMIKDILDSKIYKRYWPEMLNPTEAARSKWTETEFNVDHPLRQAEGIRDATVFTAGLTTSVTGFHCDLAILDDVVVQENAYTEEGREKVKTQYSLLASIEGTDAREIVAGTRYDPNDLYHEMQSMEVEILDEQGNIVSTRPVYEVFERQVEDRGDGTGEYLWPRSQRSDGKWFGFNQTILAVKKAQYLDKTQFYAQYYNDPNKYDASNIVRDRFQYFDRSQVVQRMGKWYVRGELVNLAAAMDMAFSTERRSDYCVICVIGMNAAGDIFVLDLYRFQTDKLSEMFAQIRDSYLKWGFKRLVIESGSAQKAIVKELKDQYLRPSSLAFSIDEKTHTRADGTKEERIAARLQPRYENMAIWHYKGGNCSLLEEELLQARPAHDDLKDALAMAVDLVIPPRDSLRLNRDATNIIYHPRFGGVG